MHKSCTSFPETIEPHAAMQGRDVRPLAPVLSCDFSVSFCVSVCVFPLLSRRVLVAVVVLGLMSLGIVSLPLFDTEPTKATTLHVVDRAHRKVNPKKRRATHDVVFLLMPWF